MLSCAAGCGQRPGRQVSSPLAPLDYGTAGGVAHVAWSVRLLAQCRIRANMFGSAYWRQPDALVRALHEMSDGYAVWPTAGEGGGLIRLLQGIYVRLLGIPEIGFRVRGWYFSFALRQLPGSAPRDILDAGSGIGAYTLRLAKAFPGASVLGWDVDLRKVELATDVAREAGIRNAHFEHRDICADDLPESAFDLVLSIDVLEHIDDHTAALRNLRHVLRPGGFLLLQTPQSDQRRVFRRFYGWHHADHCHEGFLRKDLIPQLMTAGFIVLSVRETFGFPGRLAWELNHMALARSKILAGLSFPFLGMIALLDLVVPKRHGLATAVIAKRPSS